MAFQHCAALSTVYYTGTEEQWAAVTVENHNDSLNEACVICSDTRGVFFSPDDDYGLSVMWTPVADAWLHTVSFSRDGGATWDFATDLAAEEGLCREILNEEMPAGVYNKAKVEGFDYDWECIGSYECDISLGVDVHEGMRELNPTITEDEEGYLFQVSGLAGEYALYAISVPDNSRRYLYAVPWEGVGGFYMREDFATLPRPGTASGSLTVCSAGAMRVTSAARR